MNNTKKQFISIETVKSLMETKHIDEKELARLMSITLPTIKKFLKGANQNHMSSIVLCKLAIALDVKPHLLLNEEYR